MRTYLVMAWLTFIGGMPLLLGAEAPWNANETRVTAVDLEEVVQHPDAYVGEVVKFTCRYHKAEDMFNPYYTGLSKYEFNNFSVWGLKSVLFHEKGYASDVPFLFTEIESKVSTQAAALRKFEVVTITGKVVNAYLGKPWIVVSDISDNLFSVTINDASLIRARLGLELLDKREPKAAAAEFNAVLDTRLDDYLEAQIRKYYGKALLDAGEPSRAASELDDSFDEIADADTGAWLAQALLAGHHASSAASAAVDTVEQFPTHLESRLVCAEAYAQLGKSKPCVQHARAALALDAGNMRAYASMAKALSSESDDDATLALLREAESQSKGDHGVFHREMARIYFRQGRHDFAVNEFELAKRSFPGDASIYLETARALRERGSKYHRSAAVNYSRSLELDPSQMETRLELGLLLYGAKEYGEASKVMADYVTSRHDDIGALVVAGLSHEWTGSFENAVHSFTQAEELDGSGYHSMHLGFCHSALNQDTAAAEAYRRGAESDIEDRFRHECAFRASGFFLKLGRDKEALKMALLAQELDGTHAGTMINLILSQERVGDHDDAFKNCVLASTMQGAANHMALIRQHQAFNALAQGDASADVLGWAREGLVRGTDAAKLTYGLALARGGVADEALTVLSSVVESEPLARLGMAQALLSSGKTAEAKAMFGGLEEPEAQGFNRWYGELEDALGN